MRRVMGGALQFGDVGNYSLRRRRTGSRRGRRNLTGTEAVCAMKITAIKNLLMRVEWQDWHFVKFAADI